MKYIGGLIVFGVKALMLVIGISSAVNGNWFMAIAALTFWEIMNVILMGKEKGSNG